MLIASLNRIPGKKIVRTIGFIHDGAVYVSGIKDNFHLNTEGAVVGGKSEFLEKLIQDAFVRASETLVKKATGLEANAVVALTCAHNIAERAGQIIVSVTVTGTAVVLEDR